MFVVQDPKLLLALQSLYIFESKRNSGPHGGVPGFQPWTKEEVLTSTNIDGNTLDGLIELLDHEKQLMKIPAYDGQPDRFTTRTSEMVRTLGTLHDYVNRNTDPESDERQHLQIIEATKWIPALLERPNRVEIQDFIHSLKDDLEIRGIHSVQEQPVEVVLRLVGLAIQSIAEVTIGGVDITEFRLTRFQDRAIRRALLNSFNPDGNQNAMIVAAGTGSGKTIAFTVPVLVDAVLDTLKHRPLNQGRWTQLLMYPRNDLAFDQFSTLRDYCARLNYHLAADEDLRYANLCIALDADGMISNEFEKVPSPSGKPQGQWDQNWRKNSRVPNVVGASASRYGGVNPHQREMAYRPANIIIAGSESFRRRLLIPEVCRAIQSSLHRVVYDEIHLAEGTNGGHLRGLFNRLRKMAGRRDLQFIGASATIASPEQHVEAIWGVEAQDVQLSQPTTEEANGAPGGIANHVLVRPRSGVTRGLCITRLHCGHQSKPLTGS